MNHEGTTAAGGEGTHAGQNTCRTCAGEGTVRGVACSECGGTGVVIEAVGEA